jgi:transposase
MTALAVEVFALPMENLRCGRDFAAWLGLVPRQFSSGGKERLGHISKARAVRYSQAADNRRQVASERARLKIHDGRIVARTHDGPQATNAGRERAGQHRSL